MIYLHGWMCRAREFAVICMGAAVLLANRCTAAEPPRPQIPQKTFNIADYGAVADGTTLNTAAIAKAITACTAAGGGSVIIPAGKYLTGPITLASNLNLHLEKDAVLLISNDQKIFKSSRNRAQNCIIADNCHDLAITGAGTIDGQGAPWWAQFTKAKNSASGSIHRPYLIVLSHCERILVQGITLTNSPSFHLVPRECRDVTIDSVQFQAPAKAPNTDGLDPSGWNCLITNCRFDVGDDCIAIKATGAAEDGHLSCEDFTIANCTFEHGHGMSIGGQSNGGLRRMIVRDCNFDGTDAGIRMKAPRGSGGVVEDLLYENLKMTGVKVPILITSYYPRIPDDPASDPAQELGSLTPIWRHIQITNLTATDSPSAGEIIGLAEAPVEDVVLTDVHISAAKGLRIVNARGIHFVNSSISAQSGPAITAGNAEVTGLNLVSGH